MKSRLLQALVICYFLSCNAMAGEPYDQVKSDLQANRTGAALKTLRGMVKQKPDDYQAWFLLGVANARQQQYHQAIEAFRRVIELNPELAEPHNNLAVIYNELGDVRAAVGELEQSLKKRPGYAIAEENLADLYVKLALENYRSALAKAPTPALEKRYARLLQVRDPVASPAPVEPIRNETETAKSGATEKEAAVAGRQPTVVPVQEVAMTSGTSSPAVAEAEKESVQTEASPPSENPEKQLLDAVEMWRAAWSARDLAGYFLAYASDFQVPERFASWEEWQAYKQRVIGSKSYIQVELSDFQVEMDEAGKRARVKFFQKFRSNSYNGDNLKVLEMKLDDGMWKIVSEVSLS